MNMLVSVIGSWLAGVTLWHWLSLLLQSTSESAAKWSIPQKTIWLCGDPPKRPPKRLKDQKCDVRSALTWIVFGRGEHWSVVKGGHNPRLSLSPPCLLSPPPPPSALLISDMEKKAQWRKGSYHPLPANTDNKHGKGDSYKGEIWIVTLLSFKLASYCPILTFIFAWSPAWCCVSSISAQISVFTFTIK